MPHDVYGHWYPKLFEKQMKIFNSRARALLVEGPRLSGKCTTPASIVYTSTGLKRLGRMRPEFLDDNGFGNIDEKICSWDGHKITESTADRFYVEQSRSALCAELANGYRLTGSPTHPVWCCWSADGETRFGYMSLSEIQRRRSTGGRIYIPLMEHPNFGTQAIQSMVGVAITEDVAYLLGALVGDGSCNKIEEGRCIGFTNIDEEVICRVRNAVTALGGKLTRDRPNKPEYRIAGSKIIRHLLIACGINKLSYFKRIPDCIIESPKRVLSAFVRALFDTDGTVESKNVSFCTTSDNLADDVQQVLAAFGILCVRRFKKSASGRPTWNIFIMGRHCDRFAKEIGFDIQRKQQRIKPGKSGKRRSHHYTYPEFLVEDLQKLKERIFVGRRMGRRTPIRFKPRVGLQHTRWYLNQALPWLAKPFLMSVLSEAEAVSYASALEDLRDEFAAEHWRPRSWHRARRFLCNTSGYIPAQDRLERIIEAMDCRTDLTDYLVSDSWIEIKSVTETEADLVDLCVPDKQSFLASGFINHNTVGVLHKVVRHLYEMPRARVGMFARTMKSSKDGGSWSLLHDVVLREWFEANIGMRYTTTRGRGVYGWKLTDTRTPFFRVSNAHGGESELLLFSLDYDNDVEDKLKEMQFSMIYFSELDKFGDRRVLTVALPSLRMQHLPFESQMWIADTNPSEEGAESWIYKLFLQERLMTYEQHCDYQRKQDLPVFSETDFREFYGNLDSIQILPSENPFVDPRQLQEVRVACGADAGLYARHIKGEWVWGGGDASRHFRAIFRRELHVIGNVDSPDESEWLTALPSVHCYELVTGWDLGDVNHAACMMEETMFKGRLVFTVLDEQVSLHAEVSNEMFTAGFMELVEKLEAVAGRALRLDRSWSDRSSLERYSAAADTYAHTQVYSSSGERIFLQGAPKGKESVRLRVRILKELLAQGRFFVSAHCTHTIGMLQNLRKGKSTADFVIGDERHIFDAITYALMMELREDYELRPVTPQGNRSGMAIQIA